MANTRRGGASIGQPMSFFKGGRKSRSGPKQTGSGPKRTRRLQGGFYPSLMGGVLQNGPFLMTAAFTQGSRLISGSKERMATRKRTHRSRRRRAVKA